MPELRDSILYVISIFTCYFWSGKVNDPIVVLLTDGTRKNREFGKELHMVFVDLEKAYGREGTKGANLVLAQTKRCSVCISHLLTYPPLHVVVCRLGS